MSSSDSAKLATLFVARRRFSVYKTVEITPDDNMSTINCDDMLLLIDRDAAEHVGLVGTSPAPMSVVLCKDGVGWVYTSILDDDCQSF